MHLKGIIQGACVGDCPVSSSQKTVVAWKSAPTRATSMEYHWVIVTPPPPAYLYLNVETPPATFSTMLIRPSSEPRLAIGSMSAGDGVACTAASSSASGGDELNRRLTLVS